MWREKMRARNLEFVDVDKGEIALLKEHQNLLTLRVHEAAGRLRHAMMWMALCILGIVTL